MKISQRAKVIEPSLGRKLFNMAQQFDDVIDLTLGDPDIVPSHKIRDAACSAINQGKTRYSANKGLLELRKKIAESVKREYQLSVDPEKEIILTVGAMEALFLSISCLIDEGDEVIIQAPYYINYVQMVRMCGGIPKIIYTDGENDFSFTTEQLEGAVTERTVAIIINSPCNPTGAILKQEKLEQLAAFAIKHDLVVISDEVYRSLVFDDVEFKSILNCKGMAPRTILIDSLSKRFAMTGYRIGYAIANEELVNNMTKMQENVAACAPLPSQYAGIAAFSECLNDREIFNEFAMRRDYIYQAINSMERLSCKKPEATFYLFVNIAETGLNCLDFAYRLLESQHVAVVPGITYGSKYEDYIRISFTLNLEKLQEAVGRIAKFIQSLD